MPMQAKHHENQGKASDSQLVGLEILVAVQELFKLLYNKETLSQPYPPEIS